MTRMQSWEGRDCHFTEGNSQELSDVPTVPGEVVAEPGPALTPRLSSRLWVHCHLFQEVMTQSIFISISYLTLLYFLPTATKANNRPKQFQFQAVSFFTQKSMVRKGAGGGDSGWRWGGRCEKLQRGWVCPGSQPGGNQNWVPSWNLKQLSEKFLPL